jgi:hypothetical protein
MRAPRPSFAARWRLRDPQRLRPLRWVLVGALVGLLAIQCGGQTEERPSTSTSDAEVPEASAIDGSEGIDGSIKPVDSSFCANSFGDRGKQFASAVAIDPSGNIVMAGFLQGKTDFGGGPLRTLEGQSAFVAKFDAKCTHVWSKTLESASASFLFTDDAGGIYVLGSVPPTATAAPPPTGRSGEGMFVTKLDATGSIQWSKRFGRGVPLFEMRRVAMNAHGEMVLAGSYCGPALTFGGATLTDQACIFEGPTSESDFPAFFLAKLDAQGNYVFGRSYPSTHKKDRVSGLAIDAAGSLFVSASGAIAKLGATDGAELWTSPTMNETLLASDGQNVFAVSSTPPITPDPFPVSAAKYTSDGTPVWQTSLNAPGPPRWLAASATGELHLAGQGSGGATSLPAAFLVSLAADGSVARNESYGVLSADSDPGGGVAVGPAREVVLVGGFIRSPIDFGNGQPLHNAYPFTSDAFLARNPTREAMIRDPLPVPTVPAPTLVHHATTSVLDLVVNATSIFWFDASIGGGTILQCAKGGCGPGEPIAVASNLGTVAQLAANDSAVYALTGTGTLAICSGGSCAYDSLPGAFDIDLAADAIISSRFDQALAKTDIVSCPLAGCGATSPTVLRSVPGFAPYSFATSSAGPAPTNMPGVFACPLAGCGGAVAMPGTGWFFGSTSPTSTDALVHVATDGKNVLVLDHVNSYLAACPLTGCEIGVDILGAGSDILGVAYANPKFRRHSFAADASSVYFIADTIVTDGIRKCPVSGCLPSGPTPLAVGLERRFEFFALDDTSVYFVTGGDIVRVPN